MTQFYHAIGLMSGSSLDGLDIAYVRFETNDDNQLAWEIIHAECAAYPTEWSDRLLALPQASAETYARTHIHYGRYLGEQVKLFIDKYRLKPDFVASHGHTIFHNPADGYTSQIGDGASLAVAAGCTAITDFRYTDIALGGQGAPLAPIADMYLFPGFDFYLNLGGIANISAHLDDRYIAFDISGANALLNYSAQRLGQEYDAGGKLAATGHIDNDLLNVLNSDPYFGLPYPKSLSNQWVRENMVALLRSNHASPADQLRTSVEHIATQIADAIVSLLHGASVSKSNYRLLATGGGTFNTFLIDRLRDLLEKKGVPIEIILPSDMEIKFKEAALMALMGLLRITEQENCLRSVTGAVRNSIAGAVYLGNS